MVDARIRIAVLGSLVVAGLAWLYVPKHTVTVPLHDLVTPLYRAAPTEPTVVLVVLDTVRADRMGSCGYPRPTTPFLDELVSAGASLSCEARAPGSWTLPSHASFFTGLSVVDHGADMASGSCDGCFAVNAQGAHPLGPDAPTLAERFVERGYQTAMVSMNPVLLPFSGLTRGFQRAYAPEVWPGPRGENLVDHVRSTLRASDPSRPLFLFVNIAEAHDPLPIVPSGHAFLPQRAKRDYSREAGSEWEGLLAGTLTQPQRASLLAHLGDLYDHGIEHADRTLRRVVDEVRAHGWADAGLRLVVVSDHGEYLGEHDLFYHGLELFDGQQRVPLLVSDTAGPVRLPAGPIAGADVFQLTLDGQLHTPSPVISTTSQAPWFAERHHAGLGGTAMAAGWVGDTKQLARPSGSEQTSLQSDPGEVSWQAIEAPTPAVSEALEGATALDASTTSDADLQEMLKAAGYIEDDP